MRSPLLLNLLVNFHKIHQGADTVGAALGVIIFNPISLVTMVNGSLLCVS
jgi:hypothetical protein